MLQVSRHPRAVLFVLVAATSACRTGDDGGTPGQQTSGLLSASASNQDLSVAHPRSTIEVPPVADGVTRARPGEIAPDFTLEDLDGKEQRLASYRGKIVVLEWFNPRCRWVEYAYRDGPLAEMHERHASHGIVWLAINSTAPGQDGADPADNREFARDHRLRTPILLDPTGVVGKSFGAKTTPQIFVINERGMLVYAGALDNAPLGRVETTVSKVNFLDAAIADLRSGHAVTTSETRPYGCGVKYGKP